MPRTVAASDVHEILAPVSPPWYLHVSRYSLTHLADPELLRDLASLAVRERETTADLIAYVAEVDDRRLYLPAAYSSMLGYCMGELRLTKDAALKRIHAARAARRFPDIFAAVAEGHLTLTAVVLLAPHLNPENAVEVLARAAGKGRFEVEQIVTGLAPRHEVPATHVEHAARHTEASAAPASADTASPAARHVASRVATPVAPDRIALSVTVAQATHDKLRYARELLGHAVPSGDLAQVLDRALDALIAKLEARRFGKASRLRPDNARGNGAARGRHVPAAVRHEVWVRDGGQCTFTSASGHRCESRTRLEFDHVKPHACGGEATVANLRLRCRAHNQYAAEQAFGADATRGRRARREHAARHTERSAAPASSHATSHAARHVVREAVAPPMPPDHAEQLTQALRTLGVRAADLRRGLDVAGRLTDATVEQRLRAALSALAPRVTKIVPNDSRGAARPQPHP